MFGNNQQKRRTAQRRRIQGTTKLGLEQLESKQMCAGDIAVWQDAAGYLRICGDSRDNRVVVAKEATGVVSVEASIDTRLNGRNGGVMNFTNVRGISAEMGAGNDSLTLTRRPTAQAFSLAAVDILMAENVNVFGVQSNQIKINGGPGASSFYLTEVVANQAQLDTGAQNDGVFIGNSKIGNGGLRLDTRAGSDHVQIYNTSVFGRASIRTDGGNDRVQLISTTPAVKTIDDLFLSLGDGNDILEIDRNFYLRSSSIDGGTGTDRLASHIRLPSRPTNFEL